MACFNLKSGEKIELQFYMSAYDDIAAEFGDYAAMKDQYSTQATSLDATYKLACIFARCAARYRGDTVHADLTPEWLRNHMRPVDLKAMAMAVAEAFREAMDMDSVGGEADDQPRDMVLDEIEKKRAGA